MVRVVVCMWAGALALFAAAIFVAWMRQDREEETMAEIRDLRDVAVKDAQRIAWLENENRLLEAQLSLACSAFIAEVLP